MRRTTSRGRVYSWKGRNYWSVTTIIKNGLPSPALMAWGMKAVAEYAVGHHKQLYAMVEAAAGDPSALEPAVGWLKGAPYRDREKAADLGTAIHGWAEAHVIGKPMPEPPPEVAPYLAQFQRFLADFAPDYIPEMAEAPVFNSTESYAGTLDAIARIGDLTFLIDYKTGKGVYPEAALQLAAYSRAEFVAMPDGSERPLPKIDGAAVLHLQKDGYALIPARIDDDVYRGFLYCREIFRFVEEVSKSTLSEPQPNPVSLRFLYQPEAA